MIFEDKPIWSFFNIKAECMMCHLSVTIDTIEEKSVTELLTHLESCHGASNEGDNEEFKQECEKFSHESNAETTTDLNFKEEEYLNGFGSPPQECINNETEEPVVIQIKKSEKFVSENQFTFNELMERKKHYPFMHFEPDPNDPQRSLCKICQSSVKKFKNSLSNHLNKMHNIGLTGKIAEGEKQTKLRGRRGKPLLFQWNIWDHWNNESSDHTTCKYCSKYEDRDPKADLQARAKFTKNMRKHTERFHKDKLSEDHINFIAERNELKKEESRRENARRKQKRQLLNKSGIGKRSSILNFFSEVNEEETSPTYFQCNICQEKIIRGDTKMVSFKKNHLKSHMRSAHGLDRTGRKIEKKHLCPQCGKEYDKPDSLRYHLLTHLKTPPIVCPYEGCEKRFFIKNNNSYDKHIKTHTGEKPFMCNECGGKFSTKTDLNRHFKEKHSEWEFSCDVCQQRFPFKHKLLDHVKKVHTCPGEKAFECQECGKGFSKKQNLKTHLRIHSGEMPYECTKCGQNFRYSYSLNSHQCV